MITNTRIYKKVAVFVIIFAMFAGVITPANVVKAAVNVSSLNYSYVSENGIGNFHVNGCNFSGVSSLLITVTYDDKLLKYVKVKKNDSIFGNSIVQTNEEEGVVSFAIVDALGLYFSDSHELFNIEYEAMYDGSEDIFFDVKVVECKDKSLNDIDIEYSKSYYAGAVDNSLKSRYSWDINTLWTEQNEMVDMPISLSHNSGLYSGSFTLTYDQKYIQYSGIKAAPSIKNMIVTDNVVSEGRIKIAFASSTEVNNIGEIFKVSFITKNPGWSNVSIIGMKITTTELEEVSFTGSVSTSIYVSSSGNGNNISISALDTVNVYEYLDIDVRIDDNSGFAAMTTEILYDEEMFDYIGCTFKEDVFSGGFKSAAQVSDGLVRLGVVSGDNITDNGVFATIRLQPVKEISQTYGISLRVMELIDEDLNKLHLSNSIIYVDVDGTSNHMWDDGVVIKNPTCTSVGYKEYKCNICNITMKETIEKLGHDYSGEAVIVEPDCIHGGYHEYTCKRCEEKERTMEVDALGHSFGEWTIVNEPGCLTEGSRSRLCSVCGFEESESIEPIGHTWDNKYTVDKESTCSEKGSKSIHCLVCDATKLSVSIPLTEHAYGEPEIKTAATCQNDGIKVYTCKDCGHQKEEAENKLLHDYEAIVTDPTCTEEGYTTHTCKKCGTSYRDTVVAAAGHSWHMDKSSDATYVNDGKKEYSCTTCSEKKETVEPMLILQPAVIRSVEFSESRFIITWNKVTGAEGYRLYRRSIGDDYSFLAEVKGNETQSFSDDSIMGDQTYYYVVSSFNSVQESSQGAPKNCSYALAPEITGHESVAQGIKLSWDAKDGVRIYRVYRRENSDAWQKLSDVNTTQYLDGNVLLGEQYDYCIVCMDAEGIGEIGNLGENPQKVKYTYSEPKPTPTPPSNANEQQQVTTPPSVTPPVATPVVDVTVNIPKLKSVKNVKKLKVTINCSKIKDASGYKIQYSTSAKFKRGNKTLDVKTYSKLKKGISKLKKGKKYYIRVAAYKIVEGKTYTSKWSNVKKIVITK